eukprot:jgi/Botrbrau1/18907/Bobra.177_2s0064.1
MYDHCMNPFMNTRTPGLKPMIIGETKSNTTAADLPSGFPLDLSAGAWLLFHSTKSTMVSGFGASRPSRMGRVPSLISRIICSLNCHPSCCA